MILCGQANLDFPGWGNAMDFGIRTVVFNYRVIVALVLLYLGTSLCTDAMVHWFGDDDLAVLAFWGLLTGVFTSTYAALTASGIHVLWRQSVYFVVTFVFSLVWALIGEEYSVGDEIEWMLFIAILTMAFSLGMLLSAAIWLFGIPSWSLPNQQVQHRPVASLRALMAITALSAVVFFLIPKLGFELEDWQAIAMLVLLPLFGWFAGSISYCLNTRARYYLTLPILALGCAAGWIALHYIDFDFDDEEKLWFPVLQVGLPLLCNALVGHLAGHSAGPMAGDSAPESSSFSQEPVVSGIQKPAMIEATTGSAIETPSAGGGH